MVALDGPEAKTGRPDSRPDKDSAGVGPNPGNSGGISPAGVDVEQGLDIETGRAINPVDGIDLDQVPGVRGQRPGRVLVPLLPFAVFGQAVALEGPLQAAEGDGQALLLEPGDGGCSRLPGRSAAAVAGIARTISPSSAAGCWRGRGRDERDRDQAVLAEVGLDPLVPFNDGALGKTEVSGNLAAAAAGPQHFNCIGPDPGRMRVLGIAHGHSLNPLAGDSKLLNHYAPLTIKLKCYIIELSCFDKQTVLNQPEPATCRLLTPKGGESIMLSKINRRIAIALVAVVAMMATMTGTALAGGSGDGSSEPVVAPRIIVVHVTDGSGVSPLNQEPDSQSDGVEQVDFSQVEANLFIDVGPDGISAHGYVVDGDEVYGWGAGPDGIHDEQRELGDVAAGLLSADRNCGKHTNCHVILVNYARPGTPAERIAAAGAAARLTYGKYGHRLYTVSVTAPGTDATVVGGHEHQLVGFNWYLSGTAFNANPADAPELINMISTNVASRQGNQLPVPHNWDELSRIEKIWLNPMGCDLDNQWLWSSNGTCHNKR